MRKDQVNIVMSLFLCGLLILVSADSWADPGKEHAAKAHKKLNKSEQQVETNSLTLVAAGIEVSLARQLAGQHQMIGAKTLPKGIRKQLARGKPLPPGIAKKIGKPAFINELPVHDGYEWRQCGTDLVLVSIASAVIADVLLDVFR